MTENVPDKSNRYLAEGRLTVTSVDDGRVEADCRGSGAVYKLGWTHKTGWYCACPALGLCAHLLALQAVVVVPPLTHTDMNVVRFAI